MPQPDRLLSLAAGTVRDVSRDEAVAAAEDAGFRAVGLRFDLDPPASGELARLRNRLDSSGLEVLDVEVVRLSASWNEDFELRLIEWAHSVAARHLLVVSDDDDRTRTLDGLSRVARRCREAGLSAVLEFMKFTFPKTLGDAVSLAGEVGSDLGGVLIDPLHLARSGGSPAEIRDHQAHLFPYAQLCDAPAAPRSSGLEDLIAEARHERLLPGSGALPLEALLQRLPASTPLSLEVQSDALEREFDALERAKRVHAAAQALLP